MLELERTEYISGLMGATSHQQEIQETAEQIVNLGLENVFFIGTGGTIALQYPMKYLMDCESSLHAFAYTAAEFLLMNPKHLGAHSLAIFISDSGTTKETITAARYAKEKGATTVSFVSHAGSELAQITDYVFANVSVGLYESFLIQLYTIITGILNRRNEFRDYDKLIQGISKLPIALYEVKEEIDDKAAAFARQYRDEEYHMLVGAGNMWGQTYLYAMCILEEMQWIRTKAVHAAEFFHGSLELVDDTTSVILLKGEDNTRPLMERVESFVNRYTKKLTVFDTADFGLQGIDPVMRPHFSPIVMVAALERVSKHLEQERQHPLSTRRYYKVVPY